MTSFETISLAKQGDIDARNQIILENLGIIKRIANNCQRRRFEDAVQDGIFGVIRAIQTYDVTKGGFNNYMGLWVRRTMEERTGYKEDTVLDDDVNLESSQEQDSRYHIKHELAVEEKDYMWLREAIDKLDPREKTVIDMIYFHDANQQQIADLMNLSRVTVNKIHQSALRKLRGVLA
jgi:RNA polymerase sigma factor (sigma-70 family)